MSPRHKSGDAGQWRRLHRAWGTCPQFSKWLGTRGHRE